MANTGDRNLKSELRDRDWKMRREAVLEMGFTRDARWHGALVEALDDADAAVRQAAVLSLGKLGRPQAVDELTKPKVLGSDDPGIRRAAVSVIGRIGGLQVVDALSQSVHDPDWTVRNEAIAAVSAIVDDVSELRIPETAKVLIRMLPIDDRDVREKTIRALGGFGRAGVTALVDALGMKSQRVRSGAAAALGLIRDRATVPALVRRLEDESKQVRLAAITALGNIPSVRAIGPLVERLSDRDAQVRAAAVDALGRMGRAAVIPLIEALEHATSEAGAAATLKALAQFADGRAMVPILNHLGNTYVTVRWEAVDAITLYGEQAVPLLVEMMLLSRVPLEPLLKDALRNPQKRNRLRTIRALGELKDSRAVPNLKKIGQEDDREIRDAVEEALWKIGSATWARASSAKALGQIGSADGVPALTKALGDPNLTVRLRAARALLQVGDRSAAKPLAKQLGREKSDEVRQEIVTALGTIGTKEPAAVTACIRALTDESRSVRSRAARSLGRLASPRAALPLVRALGDSYWSVRRDAENSVMNLGKRAVPPLIESLESRKSVVRIRASRILGAIGDQRAARPLRRLLKGEKDEEVRNAALEALEALEAA
jgi:HEAT repeat protein